MRIYSLLTVSILLGASILSAKSYPVHLTDPCTVGNTQLKAGDYKVNLEGSKAVFSDDHNKNVLESDVKVEDNSTKFAETVITTSNASGQSRIESIELGGSKIRVVFN
jgi:lipopolysaccharide export system protein LptA